MSDKITKHLNFTCKEILPALINRTKTTTIRKAWEIIKEQSMGHSTMGRPPGTYDKPAKFKVGDEVEIRWRHESGKIGSEYSSYFCKRHGDYIDTKNDFKPGIIHAKNFGFRCGECTPQVHYQYMDIQLFDRLAFNGRLGKVKITDVQKVEIVKEEKEFFISSENTFYLMPGYEKYGDTVNALSKSEGFSSPEQMFKYLEEYAVDLSEPRPFWLYEWRWL